MVFKIKMYDCPECGQTHDSKAEAKKCCPVEIEKVFMCPCGEAHEIRSEAVKCCPREYEETIEYECEECGESYEEEHEAENCCPTNHSVKQRDEKNG